MRSSHIDPAQATIDTVAELGDVLARLAGAVQHGGLDALPLAELPAVVATLHRLGDRLEAVSTMATERLTSSGALPVATRGWLQDEAGLGSAAAGRVMAMGETVAGQYAATGASWLAAGVTSGQVSAIAEGADTASRAIAADDKPAFLHAMERALLEYAEAGASPRLILRRARVLRARLDPGGANERASEARRAQFLRFAPDVDGVKVTGFLTPETHAVIATALQQVVDAQHREGRLPAEDVIEGDDSAARRMRRLRSPHLWALALAELCGELTESGRLGTRHGAIPRVRLDVDLADLHVAFGGVLHAPGVDDPSIVGNDTMRRLLCDAEVTAALTSGARPRCTCGCGCGCGSGDSPTLDDLMLRAGRDVLYVGRSQRVVTPRQRRALEVRDQGHCAAPGCGVPALRCRAHHVVHWEQGGPTDLDNLLLVCDRHHHAVHEGGWSLAPTAGLQPHEHGYYTWVPPARTRP